MKGFIDNQKYILYLKSSFSFWDNILKAIFFKIFLHEKHICKIVSFLFNK